MRIAFISDIHYGNLSCPSGEGSGPFTHERHMEFASLIHAEKPDVLVVAGDVAETNWDPSYLNTFLEMYRNPHGESLFMTGNHDVWCVDTNLNAYEKYSWNFMVAERYGWRSLKNRPWNKDGVCIAGSMGWFDFSSIPPEYGRTAKFFEKHRNWEEYQLMAMKGSSRPMPMTEFCEARMLDFKVSLGQVPPDTKKLVIVSHYPGFPQLMGPIRDVNSSFFGNWSIGSLVREAKPTVYYCGHTHSYVDGEICGIRCVNNGSGYGDKRFDIIDI